MKLPKRSLAALKKAQQEEKDLLKQLDLARAKQEEETLSLATEIGKVAIEAGLLDFDFEDVAAGMNRLADELSKKTAVPDSSDTASEEDDRAVVGSNKNRKISATIGPIPTATAD